MGERNSPEAGETTLASATAAIIAARWSAPAAHSPLPRRTPGASPYGGDGDAAPTGLLAGANGHGGNAQAANGHPGYGHAANGNGYANGHGAGTAAGPIAETGSGGAFADWGAPSGALTDATMDGLPPVSPGQPTATAPTSPAPMPFSASPGFTAALPEPPHEPGPPVSPAPYVHGQGPGIGAAAASYFAGASAGGFGAAADAGFFNPVAPDPVPEVFPVPVSPGPLNRDAGWEVHSPQEEVRTQVPPGFERRNFGPFPEPAAPSSGGWVVAESRPRGEDTRAPEALLGVLPPAPPTQPMPASFAPPEPAPWTDSGWVGFGDLGVARDSEPAPERTDALVGAGAVPAQRTPLPRRVPRIPDFDMPGIGVSEPAADVATQQQELNRIADFLSRGDTEPVTEDRPDGVDLDAVLTAIRRVPEVRDVQLLGWNDQAGHTLRIEYADGVDESEVTRSVARLLRAQLGLAGQAGVEESAVDSPYRRAATTGRPVSRPQPGVGRALPRPLGPAAPRLVVENVTVTRLGAEATVEVRLRQPGSGAVSVGESSGPGVDAYLSRLAATAASAAVDRVLASSGTARGKVFVEHVSVVPFGVVEVAVVVLLLTYDGVTEQLSGSAIVGDDAHVTVVRATLAALNRRLESLLA